MTIWSTFPQLLLMVLFSLPVQQIQSASTRAVIHGSAETAEGCPVTVSDAGFVRLEHLGAKHRFEIVQNEAKIQNLSGRAIRGVWFTFEFESSAGGMTIANWREDRIASQESRQVARNMSYKFFRVEDYQHFTAKILGIEFEDGSRWVAPRAFIAFPLQSNVAQRAPVTVVNCLDLGTSYRASLRFHSDKVSAYRLGVVKDTVDGFETALGSWVNLPEPPAKGSALPISAGDESPSLTQDQIFSVEPQVFLRKNGMLKSLPGGVALFVAEVKLKDGKTWSQSLKRDDLLYPY